VEDSRDIDTRKRTPHPPLGKCSLLRELGRGGMGVVYEAVDTQLDRKVAFKIMVSNPNAAAEERALEEERFVREAQLAARLPKHPHIVSVYEVGVIDGKRYLAIEFIDGQPVSKWRKSGSITIRQQVTLLRDVALAVHHAHQNNVIHRDLKPENILVDAANQPHITDFGLAKTLGQNVRVSLTAAGMLVGTPTHMSPEQAQGLKSVDHRTDVYALGVTLYETLTGRLPFLGETPIEVLMKTIKNPVPAPSSVSRAGGPPAPDRVIERICLKALAKKPADRYASAAAFAEGLTKWLSGEDVQPSWDGGE
jgi:serine/threonine protein kinase